MSEAASKSFSVRSDQMIAEPSVTPPAARQKIVLALHQLGRGGTDRVACLLASGFSKAGFDVVLAIFCVGGPGQNALEALIDPRVKVKYFGVKSGSRTRDLITLSPVFVKFLRQTKPDYVMATGNNMSWVTALCTKFAGTRETKLIIKTTNPINRSHDGGIANFVRKAGYRLTFSATESVLTLSDAETAILRREFPATADKFQTVINPYVTEAMLAPRDASDINNTEKLVIAVGRLSKQKRFDKLIEGFAKTSTQGARLVILGEGKERTKLEDLIQSKRLEDRIELAGFKDNISSWYQRADLFVLTSDYEGLPAVVLEAMAGGCPVLTTDCFAAAREIISKSASCEILESTNPHDLALQIDQMLRRQPSSDIQVCAKKYSVESGISSHIEEIFGPVKKGKIA